MQLHIYTLHSTITSGIICCVWTNYMADEIKIVGFSISSSDGDLPPFFGAFFHRTAGAVVGCWKMHLYLQNSRILFKNTFQSCMLSYISAMVLVFVMNWLEPWAAVCGWGERTWVLIKWGDRRRDQIGRENMEGEAVSVLFHRSSPTLTWNTLQTCWPVDLSTLKQRFTAASWTFISMLRSSLGVPGGVLGS